jgi:hypothetical protein
MSRPAILWGSAGREALVLLPINQSSEGRVVMCGRPLGFKSFEENSDEWVDCDHMSGLT